MDAVPVRLSTLAHGGGCKLDPAVLRQLLADQPAAGPFERPLVGNGTAADGTRLIATTDFCTPMVDDPRDLGRIAATDAISDVYAMGGKPSHGLELARGANLTLVIKADALPLLPAAEPLARDDFVTGATHRNWAAVSEAVSLPDGFPDWRRHLLIDPQTSGGLLVACEAGAAEGILARIREGGYASAAVIGRMEAGPAGARVM